MAVDVRRTHDFGGVARITNLPDPASAQEPATKAYVDAAVEGLAWKDSVRVKTQGNINLAAPGATIDGITMVSGDRFLAGSQSTASQNGIYIWNGAATPATRALDASTFAELEGAVVTVEEGTDADTSWRQTEVNGTIDSSTVTFSSFGTSAPAASETVAGVVELATQAEVDTGTDTARAVTPAGLAGSVHAKKKFSANFGDGSATSFNIDHNLNTFDVQVEVFRNSGNRDSIVCEVQRSTVNRVILVFDAAPTASQFRVVIIA